MDNVVKLAPGRGKPRRAIGIPRSGARILFFTGVRYCRDEAPFIPSAEPHVLRGGDSGLALELAAH